MLQGACGKSSPVGVRIRLLHLDPGADRLREPHQHSGHHRPAVSLPGYTAGGQSDIWGEKIWNGEIHIFHIILQMNPNFYYFFPYFYLLCIALYV